MHAHAENFVVAHLSRVRITSARAHGGACNDEITSSHTYAIVRAHVSRSTCNSFSLSASPFAGSPPNNVASDAKIILQHVGGCGRHTETVYPFVVLYQSLAYVLSIYKDIIC